MTLEEEDDAKVRRDLQALGRYVDKQLPYGWGFVLLAFPFGADGRMNYIANANRTDVVRSMYEFIEMTKEKWAKDVPEESSAAEDEQIARLRQRVAELEGYLVQATETLREADEYITELKEELRKAKLGRS